jgi:5-methylcytosine-specific restriction endonuclease McrA
VAIRAHPWCPYSGRTDDLTGDHDQPLSRGGKRLPSVEEIIVACRSCNSSKGNRTRFLEWGRRTRAQLFAKVTAGFDVWLIGARARLRL